MGTIIKEIKISDDSYSFISEGKEGDVLKNLSKINIFVGQNNSGKSRFLRSIVKNRDLKYLPNNNDYIEINEFIRRLNDAIQKFIYKHKRLLNSQYMQKLNSKLHEVTEIEYLEYGENHLISLFELNDLIKSLDVTSYSNTDPEEMGMRNDIEVSLNTDLEENVHLAEPLGKELINILDKCSSSLEKPLKDYNFDFEFNKIYIPILRGSRTINLGVNTRNYNYKDMKDYSLPYDIDSDLYKFRTLLDYFASEVEEDPSFSDTVFTGLSTYDAVRNHKVSEDEEKQDLMDEFEEYLSENFFVNEKVKITSADDENGNKKDVIIVKIGNERGKPIYDLGDGIQSIITITLPLFLIKDKIKGNENVLVFIEEPEHLLHPSLQRKLIETFNDERFKGFQFFFTTHSNHFLDISLDFEGISMFTVSKHLDDYNNSKFLVKNVDFGDNNLLNLLGIRSSSVFLTNCNIWVEGITDVLYLRRFFNIYQDYMKKKNKNFKKFDEDRHYSFYVYNGSDITNLLDLSIDTDDRRLNRLLVVRDGDTEKVKHKKAENDELKNKLSNKFKLLDCWEVENLLAEHVILKTLEKDKRYRNKISNKTFKPKEYKNGDLGDFIKVNVCGNQIGWNPIKKKKKFYERVEKNIVDWDDLSKGMRELCDEIHNFIKENNL
ncbi:MULTISPECIES: ATP-binding protein [Methanobacterium]|uniref:Endonuclease GajA/Old nuclease/RecF-like AAA domain-containing protein n=1 Tax=Methanobacterium bryantii TaxID=2161 RepID=A0A2A2H2X1_METBR|nr:MULTISPECIES: ATP-binding protein [Methanobacterium]OEC87659.1 hypothetical protein A9507_00155 [Methanobacterium sp. A39]PAV03705.1 hypothetical protein ASJ80_01695 [Methanobacterium bryantii]